MTTHAVDLAALSTRRLLRLYADILTELVRRGVRSRNAPAGDLGEHLVHRAYGGELGARSEKSWDVRAADGRLLQVKTRLLAAKDRGSHVYSPFRSFDFDACVFLIFDAHTYELVQAVEVPRRVGGGRRPARPARQRARDRHPDGAARAGRCRRIHRPHKGLSVMKRGGSRSTRSSAWA